MGLPSGYTLLEYIESAGDQYVSTGFKPNNNTRVVIDCLVSSAKVLQGVFGGRTSGDNNTGAMFVVFATTLSQIRSDYNGAYTQMFDASRDVRYTIDKNKETTTVNGVSQSYANAEFQSGGTLTIFAVEDNGTIEPTSKTVGVRVYSCQVYDDGTLIRDYIPALNAGGVAGLYDQCNDVFYTNAGAGVFRHNLYIEPAGNHNTLIGGTAYEITGGRTLIDGTGYEVVKGRTLIDGTGYDILFGDPTKRVFYTGTYNIYGNEQQGWAELLTSGTLTLEGDLPVDIYLLSCGYRGHSATGSTNTSVQGGAGGAGGIYKEHFGLDLSGSYDVVVATYHSNINYVNHTTLGEYTSQGGIPGAIGGTSGGYSTKTAATKGGNGRKPFADANPMTQGLAAKLLAAGGGGGGAYNGTTLTYAYAGGGTYGGGSGGNANNATDSLAGKIGTANTGSGGGGASVRYGTSKRYDGGVGCSGIAIVRWGY